MLTLKINKKLVKTSADPFVLLLDLRAEVYKSPSTTSVSIEDMRGRTCMYARGLADKPIQYKRLFEQFMTT